jgi:enterochelin esterase-like enzyme
VAPRLLDRWVAQRVIQPIVVLFVAPHRYGNQLDYEVQAEAVRAFFTRDLLAWAASRYGVTRSADERALLAVSAGAEAALDAGHAVDYLLVAEGHTRATWRDRVRDVLASLFGASKLQLPDR